MECSRCNGLMVRDHVLGMLHTEFQGLVWRCVCCGNILDSFIAANRRTRQPRRARPPKFIEANEYVEPTAA